MNQRQSEIVSFLSLALGLFGIICGVCISQGIKLPFEKEPRNASSAPDVRMGSTVIVALDTPVNIESDLELHASGHSCDGESCEFPSEPEVIRVSEIITGNMGPGAARRRPEAVSKERAESARGDGSSLKVPGGAVWATDAALEYDPMNGEL